MTQVVMVIMASDRQVKKSRSGFPRSSIIANVTPINTAINQIFIKNTLLQVNQKSELLFITSKEDKAQNVSAIGEFSANLPSVEIIRVPCFTFFCYYCVTRISQNCSVLLNCSLKWEGKKFIKLHIIAIIVENYIITCTRFGGHKFLAKSSKVSTAVTFRDSPTLNRRILLEMMSEVVYNN